MLAKLFFICGLFLSIVTFSQDFKPFEMKRLEDLGFNLNENAQKSSDFSQLHNILELEQRRRTSKTFGYIFAGLGVFTSVWGGTILHQNRNDPEGLGQFIGGSFLAVGVGEMGFSIPFFLAAKKRKRKRDALIQDYKME